MNHRDGDRRDGPRVNEEILNQKVRLIGEDGQNHDIVSIDEAMRLADQAGLDLVEISPNVDPPVCKILDYGKYKYEQRKRRNEAKKKQKTIEVKEIKFRPNIETHDYSVKINQAKKFINDGNKVKITIRFRGRELAHQELGRDLLDRIKTDLLDISKVEQAPNMEGRQMMMVIVPNKMATK